MAVFVLDCHKQPLMPCSEKRARLLLGRKRAAVHRLWPFTIRLKDRRREESQVQPVALKLDPGSKTTGMALERLAEGLSHHLSGYSLGLLRCLSRREIAAVGKPTKRIGRGDGQQCLGNGLKQRFWCPRPRPAQSGLQFGEGPLNG